MRNFAGQVPSNERWFDKVDLDAAKTCERSKVFSQAFEGCGDGLFHKIILAVVERTELDQRFGG